MTSLYLLWGPHSDDPEDGGDMFLRSICWLSTDYMALYPRIHNSFYKWCNTVCSQMERLIASWGKKVWGGVRSRAPRDSNSFVLDRCACAATWRMDRSTHSSGHWFTGHIFISMTVSNWDVAVWPFDPARRHHAHITSSSAHMPTDVYAIKYGDFICRGRISRRLALLGLTYSAMRLLLHDCQCNLVQD
jgi:hypothetical protein